MFYCVSHALVSYFRAPTVLPSYSTCYRADAQSMRAPKPDRLFRPQTSRPTMAPAVYKLQILCRNRNKQIRAYRPASRWKRAYDIGSVVSRPLGVIVGNWQGCSFPRLTCSTSSGDDERCEWNGSILALLPRRCSICSLPNPAPLVSANCRNTCRLEHAAPLHACALGHSWARRPPSTSIRLPRQEGFAALLVSSEICHRPNMGSRLCR